MGEERDVGAMESWMGMRPCQLAFCMLVIEAGSCCLLTAILVAISSIYELYEYDVRCAANQKRMKHISIT